jgi:LPS-assembly lipoprotein
MWWSRTHWPKFLLLAALVALGPAGCGFHPMYARAGSNAPTSELRDKLSSVRIDAIADREGQMLRNSLLTRLTPNGEPGAPRYELKVSLLSSEAGLGYRKDALATLGHLQVQATYTLIETTENGRSFVGQQMATAYFDYVGPRYASVAMERDAWQRAIEDLADHIATNVSMVLAGEAPWETRREKFR